MSKKSIFLVFLTLNAIELNSITMAQTTLNSSTAIKNTTIIKKVNPPIRPSFGNVVITPGVSDLDKMKFAHGHKNPNAKLIQQNNSIIRN
jgi:hypothetical protein